LDPLDSTFLQPWRREKYVGQLIVLRGIIEPLPGAASHFPTWIPDPLLLFYIFTVMSLSRLCPAIALLFLSVPALAQDRPVEVYPDERPPDLELRASEAALLEFDILTLGNPDGTASVLAGTSLVEIQNEDALVRFRLNTDGGFVLPGVFNSGVIPATGAGTRMMWYPTKGAFRVGGVSEAQWDDTVIGQYSSALGFNAIASGSVSTAIGSGTSASGAFSTAIGFSAAAGGAYSIAIGRSTSASAEDATAMGRSTSASGWGGTAMGRSTVASGVLSTAMGWESIASGNYSTASGQTTQANGYASFATGQWTVADGHGSIASGVGTTASGAFSVALGSGTTASGSVATAMGSGTTASGQNTTAMGRNASTNNRAGSFIYGDASTESVVVPSANNQFVVRASGGFLFRTSANLTTGCNLAAGSGTWTCTSSRDEKMDFQDLDGEDVLTRVAAIPVQSWRYTREEGVVRHVGPTAQDFRAAFGLGDSDEAIGHIDASGINMRAIQALEIRTRQLQGQTMRIDALERENLHLRERLAAIESALGTGRATFVAATD
jgi:hypothetical protein